MADSFPAHGGPDFSERDMGPVNGKPSLTVHDAAIQLDRAGFTWSGAIGKAATISYAFMADAQNPAPAGVVGFQRLTGDEIAAAERGLQAWSDVANVTFVRHGSGTSGDGAYSDDAQILFGTASGLNSNESGVTYRPDNASEAPVHVYINRTETDGSLYTGGFGDHTYTHEIGHSLGLSHPSFYDATDATQPTYANDAMYAEDAAQYSIMSYFGPAATSASFTARSSAPMLDDIAAVQRLYGANYATRSGDTTYGFNSNSDRPWYTLTSADQHITAAIWDGGGNDTLDFSRYSQNQLIDLRQGNFSNVGGDVGNVSIAVGAVIENALGGSGSDVIVGNVYANGLFGGAGDDHIVGYGGSDHIQGNAGNDTLEAGDGTSADHVTIYGGQDNDIIYGGSTGTDFLSGDLGNDTIYGRGSSEFVTGGDGADTIYGGYGAAGTLEFLSGNAGKDVITSASTAAVYIQGGRDDDMLSLTGAGGSVLHHINGNLGDDTIASSGGYATLYGGQGNDSISTAVDQTGHDLLRGDLGNDSLISSAGGSDTIIGGAGADRITITAHGSGTGDLVSVAANDSTAISATDESNLDHITGFDFTSDKISLAGHGDAASTGLSTYDDATARVDEASAYAAAYRYAFGDGTSDHPAHVSSGYLAIHESYPGADVVYVFTADHAAVSFNGATLANLQASAFIAG